MTHLFNNTLTNNEKKTYVKKHLSGGSIEGLKKLGAAYGNRVLATGQAYYGKGGGSYKSFIPNFTDSMSQLLPNSSDFRPELFNALSKEDQDKIMQDKLMQTGLMPAEMMLPFVGLFQDTREAVEETLNMRHPELLKKAITNYNNKVLKEHEMKEIDEENKRTKLNNDKIFEEVNKIFNNHLDQSSQNRQSVPNLTPIVDTSIPINQFKARGFII
jgi:hypothetical protein